MNSYAPKPYGGPAKHSSLPKMGVSPKINHDKIQTLPGAGAPLSGDILKQRLAAMQNKKPTSQGKVIAPPKTFGTSGAPMISEKELKTRRDSMHRTPPPPTPDFKPKVETTPEFLRKKLKPRSIPENESKKSECDKIEDANGDSEVVSTKKSFRNSQLMFENITAAAAKPAPKPKPKPHSFKSKDTAEKSPVIPVSVTASTTESAGGCPDNVKVDKEENNDNMQSIASETVPSQIVPEQDIAVEGQDIEEDSQEAVGILDDVINAEAKKEEENPTPALKPKEVIIPEIPHGLNAWMNHFVRNNANLAKLENGSSIVAPPTVNRNLKKSPLGLTAVTESPNIAEEEELYDDVDTTLATGQGTNDKDDASTRQLEDETYDDVAGVIGGGQQEEETYDDVAGVIGGDQQEETYDDVAGVIGGGQQEEETYDDVAGVIGGGQQEEETYDDIAGATAGGQQEDETYDDIAGNVKSDEQIPVYEVEEGENEGQEEPALYEPVETIQQYVSKDEITTDVPDGGAPKQANEKANKKREEKERKEREKLEKKRKEEAERKMKKEEEERKKKEKEERKRIEKERKLFNLKPDEEPVPVERHMVACDVKGKGKDLSITQGEYLDVISKNNCPKGKVLAQNSSGKLGYVLLKDIGIDKRKSLIESKSPVAAGVAFGDIDEEYDDVCTSTSLSSTAIMSLSSPSALENETTIPKFTHFSKNSLKTKLKNQTEEKQNGDEGDMYEEI